MSRIELNEEVRVYRTAREREKHENEAELYAVINTLECLEKAYIRDLVGAKEYTGACQKLLVQFKASSQLVKEDFPTVEEFVKKYRMNCPAAVSRIAEGRPITIQDDKGNTSASIATIVSVRSPISLRFLDLSSEVEKEGILKTFITLMDKLRLDIRAVDELHPDLRELHDTLLRMSHLPKDFEGTAKVAHWLSVLDGMSASDELAEDKIRQMVFDLEASYSAFNRYLHNG